MARRGENIHKRKDGRWEGRYIKARTPEGKIQWGYVYGTVYAEVKRVLIQKKAEADGYTLYENEASLPWGLAVNSSIADTDISKMSLTDIQNLLYHGLTSDTGDIAENETGSEFHVSGEKALYMQYGTAGEIKVNGRSVDVPTIGDTENREFPAWFNSNVLYLGTYKDEDVAVEGIDGGSITSVDLKRLRELSSSFTGADNGIKAGKNTLEMTVSGQTGKNVALLPLNYDKGWSAPSSLNFASFKYLNPGTYLLHVKSCNGSGIWNEGCKSSGLFTSCRS